MAGNKMTTKNKGKEGKGAKIMPQIGEDNEDLDFSMLRKPVLTRITGFSQARKIFDCATEEVKDLLTNECDLLYECKVCRNIFRSLVNFISHKRIYCKEKFSSTKHGHFIDPASTFNEIRRLRRTEKEYQESLRNTNAAGNDEEDRDRIPMSKDLTEVIERIAKVKDASGNGDETVSLQTIPSSSVAVFQNVNAQDKDSMRSQVKELDTLVSRNLAVLESDGRFRVTNSAEQVIQISDDDDNDDQTVLKCRICSLQFSTQKTLKFHMKSKHLESRLVFPCPDCLEIFSTSWSVYRHLFKVHRKSAAQIRRLREVIQAKAFRMDNPPAFYERRKAKTHQPAVTAPQTQDEQNQAWMENLESAGEGACCGGCGRAFERRAALLAHTQTCQPRNKALASRGDSKKIEIQIRKDYNKATNSNALSVLKADAAEINKKPVTEQEEPEKTREEEQEQETEELDVEEENDPLADAPMDLEEEQSNDSESPEKQEKSSELKPAFRLPFAMQAEKSNLAAFRQRVHPDTDLTKILCKKCDTTHSSVTELYKHMADHYKWMRYACKLCNFKHYDFDNLPEHVRIVHKLKGDSDFYLSTVKAIDGTEAMILSRCLVESENTDENNEQSETSPESRRPSRCSSDSSRLSDDSSSSSHLKETGSRKRKMYQAKSSVKKKKEVNTEPEEEPKEGSVSLAKVLKSIIGGKESPIPVKGFEENSSDMDDIEDKIAKKTLVANKTPAASRRPVRKRTRPKNEDFEYDLSNLLKLEAQGYRDSRTEVPPPKAAPTKKKVQQESQVVFDINKDYIGALVTLSKKAVEVSAAHMKTNFTIHVQRSSNVFARPMLPKILARGDKMSPRKDIEEAKDNSSPNKVSKLIDNAPVAKDNTSNNNTVEDSTDKIEIVDVRSLLNESATEKIGDETEQTPEVKTPSINATTNNESSKTDSKSVAEEKTKSKMNISALVPLKFRRQSLDLMKNPIINKNITEFTKAGMKTKVLVIKPINRNKDGTPTNASSLKFQTIKLKEPSNLDDSKQSDQVVVVKVPSVDRGIPRSISDTQVTNCEKIVPAVTANYSESSSVSDSVNIDNNTDNEITYTESTRADHLEEAVCHEVLDDVSDCNINENEKNEVNNVSLKVVENGEVVETA